MYTNHEPLVYLHDYPHLNSHQIHWLERHFKLQLHIVYQPGQHNTAANALSYVSHSAGVGDSTTIVHHSLQSLYNPGVAA